MLYRFQHAETKIETHAEHITDAAAAMPGEVRSETLVAQLKEGDGGTVAEAVEHAVESPTGRSTRSQQAGVRQLHADGEGLSFWSAFHKRALRRLRHALLLTVGTISFCLVQLPLTPLLTQRLPLAATLAATAVGLAMVCLTMYARLILLLLVPEAEAEGKRMQWACAPAAPWACRMTAP